MKKTIPFALGLIMIVLCLLSFSACKKNANDISTGRLTFARKGDEYIVSRYVGQSEVTIPNSHEGLPVTGIGSKAFRYSNVSKIIISNGIKTIAESAFFECEGLYSISIPESVTTIGEMAFFACTSLIEINVDVNNPKFTNIDGNLYTKDKKTLLVYAMGNRQNTFSVIDNVESIASYAFAKTLHVKKINLSSKLKHIGDNAFEDCSIEEFIVDNNNSSFMSKDGILYTDGGKTLFCFPSGLIQNDDIYLGDDIKTLYTKAFAYTKVKKIFINEGLEDIGDKAFEKSSLEEISISSTVRQIGLSPFKECIALISISVSNNNNFYQDINDGLYNKNGTTIISYALAKESLSFNVPKGVIEIAESAFAGVQYLEKIELPDTINTIGHLAFKGEKLETLILSSTIPPIIKEDSFDISQSITLYVPDVNLELYRSYNLIWEKFSEFIQGWSQL